ncbi:hypothetical protein QBZ16_002339 [Prototheca wickerhamii]|uniref:RNA helicase n=1 Tax=Prototheca wickerhamii TaxID=3111 RepID=A0AAD9IMH7_PROWI|nr:hypothetical protein QBZ16_002339 [Prototheca wickerhamii]
MACYTALFSTCRVTPTQNARSAALRLAVPALAARPVPTRALYSARLSGPKASAALAEWSVEDDVRQEPVPEAQTFTSLFETEAVDQEVEEVDENLLIENCGLSEVTLEALRKRGIAQLFPVQKNVLEPAMEGRDLIARARTGSGKTLAFALPAVERVMASREGRYERGRAPRVLVLTPTRELACQVERELASVAPRLRTVCVYGGANVDAQRRALEQGCDAVVGTPGRVIDLHERGSLRLGEVEVAVLDEADQMLAVGFADETERILAATPAQRQTMLFSATTPAWITRLLRGAILRDVLTVQAGGRAIVFTQTKRDAGDVAGALAKNLACGALHGDMSQHERDNVLRSFRDGRISVLVATDVAARGLDIPDVDLVVHYTPPQEAEAFLHRSGRTGRAGKAGTAVVLFAAAEAGKLRRVLQETGTKGVRVVDPPTPEEIMRGAARRVMGRLDDIGEEVRAFFRPAAQRILESRAPQEALEATLAALSGLTQTPLPRSKLTLEQGMVSAIAGRLAEHAGADRDRLQLGRIRLLPAAPGSNDEEGAAFDVAPEDARVILAAAADQTFVDQGLTVQVAQDLPPEVDLYAPDRGGRAGYSHPSRDLAPRGAGSQYGGYGRRDGGRYGGGRDGGRDNGFFRRRAYDDGADGGRGRRFDDAPRKNDSWGKRGERKKRF